MRARRWVFPLTLWTALVVAVAAKSSVYESVFGAFHGESKPEQAPSSTAVVSPDVEAHHRFKRCSTMCDKSVVFQGPTRSLGMVAGISNVANSTTDGCTKLTIRCLASAGAVYTQVSVARPDGIEVVALEAGVGPTGTTYECGDDGRWMQQNRPVAGEYYCEARLNGSCSNTCDPSTVFGGRVQTRGMVAGTASVAVNVSDGCATITIKCSGLVPNGYTHLAVALAGGVGEIDFQPGVGPLVMSYECGYDGNWTLRGFPIGGEYYCESSPPATTTTTTTTARAPTTPTSCAYPTNSTQVSLVVFDKEPRGGNTGEIGSCGCDVGKKAFYVGGPSPGAYAGTYATFVEYPLQKVGGPLPCADFCIIDEAGDECKFSNTSASMTIYFKPYCTRGKCHMYVYMGLSGDNTGSNGLICGARNYTQRDGWNADGSLKPMDPDTSPQVYVHAAAFTCKGCAAIRKSSCLGCAYPTNSSQVSLVVFDGEPLNGNTREIGSCGCDVGKKAFYVGGPSPGAFAGTYATYVKYPLQKDNPESCADLCITDEAGDECKFSNTSAKMTIYFKPYCTRGKCHMYVYMGASGDNAGRNGLICSSRNFTQRGQWNANGENRQMDPDTAPQVYVHAAAFTCKGCAAIRNSNCLKTPGCAYPTNSSQVRLIVFDGEPLKGNTPEIGSCGCDIGKKAFYVGGPTPGAFAGTQATYVNYPLQKDDPQACADLCIIDEAGDECTFSNTSAKMTIFFNPYCTRGKCHMYVYMGFSDDNTGSNGLICSSRNFTQRGQWNADGSLKPMDPDTAPQVYAHAAAFTCKGCAAIRNSNCLRRS